jgi:hypothetical protein
MNRRGADWLPALLRSQAPAAAATALYRNQLVESASASAASDGQHDFDFYFGRWHVRNERLRERLVGCRDWECFDAVQECRPILGGLGNLDEFVADGFGPGRFHGMTLRLFEPARGLWRIFWANNRSGVLEPPVVGRFRDGIGRFEGEDSHLGTPVRVRFVWSDISATTAHWEQAFSADAGRSWETNWRMHMTRLGGPAVAMGGGA